MEKIDDVSKSIPSVPSSGAAPGTSAPQDGPVLLAACAYCGQESLQRLGGIGRLYMAAWEDFREAWRTGDVEGWDRHEADLDHLEPIIRAAFDRVLVRYPLESKVWTRLADLPGLLSGSYVPILSHLLADPGRDERFALSHGICPAHYEEMMGQ